MIKKVIALVALSGAIASAHADVLLMQSFDDANALSGWLTPTASTPGGVATTPWFQGDQAQFSAHGGAPEGFLASSYNTAPTGGVVDNWLISPEFSTEFAVNVSFWMRSAPFELTSDTAKYGFSAGGGAIADFATPYQVTVGTDGWTLYTASLAAQGAGTTGRFGIAYYGSADTLNYIGVDDLSIETVPEPASIFIMGAGVFGLVAARRRRQPA